MLNKVSTHLNKLLFRLCYHEVTIHHISYFIKYLRDLNNTVSINSQEYLVFPLDLQIQISYKLQCYHHNISSRLS